MATIIDEPAPPLGEFAAYMKTVYGEGNARIMTQSLANTLLSAMDAGGDINRSGAVTIACPALLITGEHDPMAPPALVADMADAVAKGQFLEARARVMPCIMNSQRGWWKRWSIGCQKADSFLRLCSGIECGTRSELFASIE